MVHGGGFQGWLWERGKRGGIDDTRRVWFHDVDMAALLVGSWIVGCEMLTADCELKAAKMLQRRTRPGALAQCAVGLKPLCVEDLGLTEARVDDDNNDDDG